MPETRPDPVNEIGCTENEQQNVKSGNLIGTPYTGEPGICTTHAHIRISRPVMTNYVLEPTRGYHELAYHEPAPLAAIERSKSKSRYER